MLSADEIEAVAKHKVLHDMGMCSCPCFRAIMKVGEAMQAETALRVKLAKASPEALAALTIGADDELRDELRDRARNQVRRFGNG